MPNGPNTPGANSLVAERAPCKSSQSCVTEGQQTVGNPSRFRSFLLHTWQPRATPMATRREGSFSYQGVSTRGVRHSPGFESLKNLLMPLFFYGCIFFLVSRCLFRGIEMAYVVSRSLFWCRDSALCCSASRLSSSWDQPVCVLSWASSSCNLEVKEDFDAKKKI